MYDVLNKYCYIEAENLDVDWLNSNLTLRVFDGCAVCFSRKCRRTQNTLNSSRFGVCPLSQHSKPGNHVSWSIHVVGMGQLSDRTAT